MKTLMKTLLALTLLAGGGAACRHEIDQPPLPLNFVFILADDLGYMDVGAYNPETFYETPHLDRLARNGMRFTDAYTASPVCSPTRYSIQTGRYPTRAAVTNWFVGTRQGRFRPAPLEDRMPLSEFTVASALKEGGYSTFYAGKWHLGPTAEYWPEERGYDFNLGGHSAGGPWGPGQYFVPYGNPRLEDGPPGEHLPDRLATETAAFIHRHRDRPFLAFLSFYSVHTPLVGRPDLVDKYRAKAERLDLPGRTEFASEEQVWPVDEAREVRMLQSHAVYAAMVEAMDQAVGKVLDSLEEAGVADRTVVIFTSDNGGLSTSEGSPTSNLPLRGGKGWLYEGGIRIPLIVFQPGVTSGQTCAVPVMSTDFYPTMLELAGLAPRPEQHLDGTSLVPLLTDGVADRRGDNLYWHYPHYSNQGGFPGGAVRSGSWKLLERYEDGRIQLYNLADDAGERNDRAADEPARADEMRRRLHDWYRKVDARFLEPLEPGAPGPWRP